MGYTHKTSHYELPQYAANDKPSWLGDFNAAMLKIDTVMADNDATAEAANSAATGAQTQVATLSSQLSTIQGQVNTAVDTATAADGKATTAQSVATQARTTSAEAKTLAETAKTSADLATETAVQALPKSGGTMTGSLLLSGDPTTNMEAATKQYVDNAGASLITSDLTKHSNVTVSTLGDFYLLNKYAECVSPNNITYNEVVQVGTGKFLMPFASCNGNPANLTADTVYQFGKALRTRSNTPSYVPLTAYYDGSSTYLCFRNASVGDAYTVISGGIIHQ